MKTMSKKLIALYLFAALLIYTAGGALPLAYAADFPEAVKAIEQEALEGKYHFEYVGDKPMSQDLIEKLKTEDNLIFSEAPIGGLTIVVKDAETGKAIENAQLYLAFMVRRATVDQNGDSKQTANPFLLYDLGKSKGDGTFVFKDTYYYNTDVIEPGTPPFATNLQVHLANVLDKDPLVALDPNIETNWKHEDEAGFNRFMDQVGGQNAVAFSVFKGALKGAAGETYNQKLRELFDKGFARYDDGVLVKVGSAKEFSALSKEQQQSISVGDLRNYIVAQRQLFIDYVAKRNYKSFEGFEPDFVMQFEPPYEYEEKYKDGTSAMKEKGAALGLTIFDNVTGGTGYAINYSFLSYRAYVFADGYVSGKSNGSGIRQDFVDLEAGSTVYLSKSAAPVVAMNAYSTVFGTLKDGSGAPVVGARIKITDTDKVAVSNAKGEFSFVSLKDETLRLAIESGENGAMVEGYAIYKGKGYGLSEVPITIGGAQEVYHVDLVTGPMPLGGVDVGTDGGNGSADGLLFGLSLPLLLGLGGALVLCLGILLFLIIGRSRKKQKDGE